MQFNLEKDGGGLLIQNYAAKVVTIDGQRFERSLILLPNRIINDWPVNEVAALTIDSLEAIIAARPEIFLLGTGEKQVFPAQSLMGELAQRQRSVDVMDTAAACRTYNVLVAEFRQVAVALILPD